MNFEICTSIVNNIIIAEVFPDDEEDNDVYYYYLLLDGVIKERVNWSHKKINKWNLDQSGNYTVQIHMKRDNENILKLSEPIFFLNSEMKDKFFEEEKKIKFDKTEFDVDFYSKVYPYCDFAVVVGSENKISKNLLNNDENFYYQKKCIFDSKSVFLVTPNENRKKSYVFSGMAKGVKRLVVGEKDISKTQGIDEIKNSIGNFSFVDFQEQQIIIKSDYFGISKIYFYLGNDISIISNNYHMILKLTKILNINLKISYSEALANLTFISLQPFYQNFSRNMEVKGIECMTMEKFIVINSKGVNFHNTEIVNELRSKAKAINEKEYIELLYEAKEEIKENTIIALEHPNFDNVILDLSGGLDARCVYCSVTNIPSSKSKSKIKINSLDQAISPEDIMPALAINNIYQFEYNDLPEEVSQLTSNEMMGNITSNFLGTYYSYRFPMHRKKTFKTIRLNGMYGEIVARPYYSKKYLNTSLDTKYLVDFVNLYINKYRNGALLGASNKAIENIKKIFLEELEKLPGKSPIESFDLHYLYYRGSLHCNDSWRTDISVPEWGPLQSKKLFQLKMRTFSNFKNLKLQLDLVNILNPIVAKIKYGDGKYNKEKKIIGDLLLNTTPVFDNLDILENYDNTKWLQANEVKKDLSTVIINNQSEYQKDKLFYTNINLYKMSLNALIYLYRTKTIETEEVLQIYTWLEDNKMAKSNLRLQYLCNKLKSLAIQVKILE